MAGKKIIAVIGSTGSGKSTLCNVLAGRLPDDALFPVGHGSAGCTYNTTTRTTRNFQGVEFVLADTPGLDDPSGRDSDNIVEMVVKLKELDHVTMFVVVLNGQRPRLDRSLSVMLILFQQMFGPGYLKNTVFIFSRWSFDKKSIKKRKATNVTEDYWVGELNAALRRLNALTVPDAGVPGIFLDSLYDKEDVTELQHYTAYHTELFKKLEQFQDFPCQDFAAVKAEIDELKAELTEKEERIAEEKKRKEEAEEKAQAVEAAAREQARAAKVSLEKAAEKAAKDKKDRLEAERREAAAQARAREAVEQARRAEEQLKASAEQARRAEEQAKRAEEQARIAEEQRKAAEKRAAEQQRQIYLAEERIKKEEYIRLHPSYGPWEQKTILINGAWLHNHKTNWGFAIKWKKKRWGWHVAPNHVAPNHEVQADSPLTPAQIVAEAKQHISEVVGVGLDQIRDDVILPGRGVGDINPVGARWRVVWDNYQFIYFVRSKN